MTLKGVHAVAGKSLVLPVVGDRMSSSLLPNARWKSRPSPSSLITPVRALGEQLAHGQAAVSGDVVDQPVAVEECAAVAGELEAA